MAIVLNAAVLVLELWVVRLVWNRKWKNLMFYTQISNLLTGRPKRAVGAQ